MAQEPRPDELFHRNEANNPELWKVSFNFPDEKSELVKREARIYRLQSMGIELNETPSLTP